MKLDVKNIDKLQLLFLFYRQGLNGDSLFLREIYERKDVYRLRAASDYFVEDAQDDLLYWFLTFSTPSYVTTSQQSKELSR